MTSLAGDTPNRSILVVKRVANYEPGWVVFIYIKKKSNEQMLAIVFAPKKYAKGGWSRG